MSALLNKLTLCLIVASGMAVAQDAAAPHMLMEPSVNITLDPDTAGADVISAARVPKPVIVESAIGRPSLGSLGVTDESGVIPASIWLGSTQASAVTLLRYVHTGIASDTLRDLAVKLLMARSAPKDADDAWLGARIDALEQIGQDGKALQVIASVPPAMMNDGLTRKQAELLLLRGDTDAACKLARRDTEDAFWKKLIILCNAHAGKHSEAMVGIDLLREVDPQATDAFFQEAIRKMGDKNASVKSLPKEWSAFDLALLRLAGETDKLKDRVDSVPPASLIYIAADSTADAKLREKAKARAQALGLLPARDENKTPELPFTKALASDVTTLVTSFQAAKPVNAADNAVIARLAVGEGAALQDTRRVQRLLTLMEPFGYNVPADIWQKLFAHRNRFDGESPPAMLVSRLEDAVQGGRKGEVILLCALTLGSLDTDRAPELVLLPVVKALKVSGFEAQARAVAFSAVDRYR